MKCSLRLCMTFRLFAIPLAIFALFTSSSLHGQSVVYTGASPALNYGNVNVCPPGTTSSSPCGQTQTLSYSVSAGTTIGSIQILTTGAAGLDFQAKASDSSTTLCKAQSYSSASTCTVDVTFAPLAPGARRGAVEFLDGSSNVLATTYIYGTGAGAAIAFAPVVQNAIAFDSENSQAVAVDASGNIFVASGGGSGVPDSVKEIVAAGGYTTVKTLGGGFNSPSSLAVDGAGNVFVADYDNDAVKEIIAASGYTVTKTLEQATIQPHILAVDGAGNLFVAYDVKNNSVREILAASGYKKIDTLPIDNPYPNSMAIDADDNIFVATNTLFEEVLAAGGYTTVNTLSDQYEPISMALDASDNLYFIEPSRDAVRELMVAGGYTTVTSLGNFTGLSSLTLDGSGNVYVLLGSGLSEIQRSQVTLDYSTAAPGTISSPQSVTVQNIGNVPLEATGTGLTISSDWDLVAGSGTPPDCTTTFSLQPGANCNISISYEPSAGGPLSGSATLTDNALNAPAPGYAEQVISLIALRPPLAQVSPLSLAFGSIEYGAKQMMSIAIKNVGDRLLTVTPTVSGPSFYVSDNTCPAAGLAGEDTCDLQITYKPFRVGGHADSLTIATNGANNPTINLTGSATGVGPILETTLEFGTLKLHTSKTLPLKIYNYGVPGSPTVRAHINGPSYQVLPGSSCTTAGVTAGHTCTLQVEYAPVSATTHDDHITVTPSSGPPTVVQLSGTGVPAN